MVIRLSPKLNLLELSILLPWQVVTFSFGSGSVMQGIISQPLTQ